MKNLRSMRGPERMLVLFVTGSLLVMLTCLTGAASLLGFSFLKKESKRASVGGQQLMQAFEVQLNNMSEEMWTRNFEAIGMRTQRIAKQLGGNTFDAYILDWQRKCVYRPQAGAAEQNCELPADIRAKVPFRDLKPNQKPILTFDEKTDRYVFAAPLAVGMATKGYLIAMIADPYDFYRGGIVAIWKETLLPVALAMLAAWTAWLILSNRFLLKPYLKEREELKKKEAVAEVARHVAHDIKNPLSAIEKLVLILPMIPEPTQVLLRNATKQMRDIANNLLSAGAEAKTRKQDNEEPLSRLISSVVSQMRLQWKEKQEVELKFQETKENFDLFAKAPTSELRRVLANLINNAYEAVENWGTITLTLEANEATTKITIQDNGKGIPDQILRRIGEEGITHQKQEGHGLGLYHALKAIRTWNGQIKITSRPHQGTKVEIELPKANPPDWFLRSVNMKPGSEVVLLDDQKANHDIWKQWVTKHIKEPVKFIHFTNSNSFIQWQKSQSPDRPFFYLCDYDLGAGQKNGAEVIAELGITESAVLVTHHADEDEVRQKCRERGLRVLSKDALNVVAIRVENAP